MRGVFALLRAEAYTRALFASAVPAPEVPVSISLLWFLVLAVVGSYVQAVAGFAMGMILIAGASALDLFPLPVTAAVVSLLGFVNIVLSLHGHYHRIYRPGVCWMLAGQLPMVGVGVWVLELLDAEAQRALRALLGAFIIAGSAAMMVRPRPRRRLAPRASFFAAGLGGGMLGGMFSASGPVLAWFTYRQPLTAAEIRSTLLLAFAFGTMIRIVWVGLGGGLTRDVWLLAGTSLPLVLIATFVGRRFPPPLDERQMRTAAFALLLAMGGWIFASALMGRAG